MEEKLLSFEQMNEIASFFNEKELNGSNIIITCKVKKQEILNKVNEDIYYRCKADGTLTDSPDIVRVNIGDTHFEYVLDEDENTANNTNR